MLCKVTHCAGHILANTRPHQLCWGNREMGTAISCTESSQVADLIQKVGRSSSKACIMIDTWIMSAPCHAFIVHVLCCACFIPCMYHVCMYHACFMPHMYHVCLYIEKHMCMYHVLCKLKYSRWIHFCEFHELVCNHKMKVRLLCMVVHGTDAALL